ncbi:helix-turn-helix domain-containing protein [Desemzia sp. FAM 23991]|uniref:helix-turn-helix domain-containing protein n=1 Tax=unclassified Desemzia TaxID=2685243 RepID=UPI00388ADC4C
MQISQTLKAKRKEQLLTQAQVAEKIFVSQKSVSNWETGKTYPDIDSLIRLAKLYDLSLDNLLLEGSDIVEDIKEKAELKSLEKISKVAGLTSACVLVILVSQKWLGDLPLIVLLLLALIATFNMITIFYFQAKINQLKDKSFTFKDGLILLATAIVSIVLYMLFVVR